MRRRDTLGDIGELAFLRRLLPRLRQNPRVLVGPGDDCAAVRGEARLLLTTDALVEGVHFEPGWLEPEEIGAKAVLVNLSDIAAMGGVPRFLLLSVGAPAATRRADLERLHRGAERAARRHGAAVVGGNLTAAERLFVSVTAVGAASRPLLRSGARPGDAIFVTGTLGDAALAVDLLRRFGGRLREGGARLPGTAAARRALLSRFVLPAPRLDVARRLAAAGVVGAMIDVSDGLVTDLGHLCESSGTGAVVDAAALPRSSAYEALAGTDPGPALRGGEDYELLFTVPPARLRRFEALRRGQGGRITRIGEVVARPRGVRVRESGGRIRKPARPGFEHFRCR